jgi:hypothetical protein
VDFGDTTAKKHCPLHELIHERLRLSRGLGREAQLAVDAVDASEHIVYALSVRKEHANGVTKQ